MSSHRFEKDNNFTTVNIQAATKSRDEYMVFMQDYLSPLVLNAFYNIYNDCWKYATKIKKPQKTLEFFQRAIGEIAEWPESILKEETEVIEKELPWLSQVLKQILITNCLILVSVRVGDLLPQVPFHFEIPPNEKFVHRLFTKAASTFRGCVDLFDHTVEKRTRFTNQDRAEEIIARTIPSVIRRLIPLQKLVDEYFSKNHTSAQDFEPQVFRGSYRDQEAGGAGAEEGEEEEEEEPAHEILPQQQPTTNEDEGVESDGDDDGTGVTPTPSPPPPPPPPQQEPTAAAVHDVRRVTVPASGSGGMMQPRPHSSSSPQPTIEDNPVTKQEEEQHVKPVAENAENTNRAPFRPIRLDGMQFN